MRRYLVMLLLLSACSGNAVTNTEHSPVANAPATNAPADTNYMPTGFYYLSGAADGIKMQQKGSDEVFNISPVAFASVKNVISTELQRTKLEKGVYTELCMTFDAKGTNDLKEGTGNPLHPRIAAVVANRLLFVVDNTTSIKTGIMCVGLVGYSEQEIEAIKNEVDHKR